MDDRILVMAQGGHSIADVLHRAAQLYDLKIKDPIGDLYETRKNRDKYYKWTDSESEDRCRFDKDFS